MATSYPSPQSSCVRRLEDFMILERRTVGDGNSLPRREHVTHLVLNRQQNCDSNRLAFIPKRDA
jgi:hypothetical protein